MEGRGAPSLRALLGRMVLLTLPHTLVPECPHARLEPAPTSAWASGTAASRTARVRHCSPRSWPSACPSFWVLVEDPGGLGQRQTTVCQAWLGQQPGRDFPALFPEHHPAGGMDRPRDSRGQGGLRHTEKLRSGLRTPVEGTVYLLPRTT